MKKPMSKYGLVIYWSKNSQAFIAEVSELAGCATDGATYQEALANVETVIQE
jgi:predicted RNase H-like HicB family nuclease